MSKTTKSPTHREGVYSIMASYYSGREPPEAHDLTPEELITKIRQVAANIQSLFVDGVPFYTKEGIRDVSRQIDESNSEVRANVTPSGACPKFRLPVLQGNPAEVEVETGFAWDIDGVKSAMYMDPAYRVWKQVLP